jgi:hypothetical protein
VALGAVAGGLAGPGLTGIAADDYATALITIAAGGVPHAIVGAFDPRQWIQLFPQATAWPMLADLLAEAPSPGGASDREFLAMVNDADPEEGARLVVDHVIAELARVVRMDPKDLKSDLPFAALGVDSMMGLELRNRLELTTNQQLSATIIWTHATPQALAEFLLERITGGSQDSIPQPEASAGIDANPDIRQRIEDISDDELFALGEELLS